jgi:histidinol dehydrogenase
MTVCPAQAAGVEEIVVVMPPTPTGSYNKDQLAVCRELGITEVYRVGGAQAIAALAYGVEGLPRVDMIAGPGNLFVTLAKRHVYGKVGIDCLAGPSEVIVVADQGAHPEYIAIDMIAQAEHSPGASVLVTWHEGLLDEVATMLSKQLKELPRGDLARESLERFGALVLARNVDEAAELVEGLAPEHLHIQTRDPEAFADRITTAGAIFLGQYTPVALGDYAAGPSHVLPTGGTGRFASGLTANDFLRRTSVLSFTKNGMREIVEDVVFLANKEGLTAHAESVAMRLDETNHVAPRPPKKPVPKAAAAK